MKLEVGLYFRTKSGTIGKIDSVAKDGSEIYFDTKPIFSDAEEVGSKWCYATDIIKTSHNIIDLIEVGDYVNGLPVEDITIFKDGTWCITFDEYRWLRRISDIETIMTKEQFENICYKIGDQIC